MLSFKGAGQRVVVGLGDNTFSHPLPKLSLRSPKLFSVFADYQRRFFLFLFLLVFVCAHTAFRLRAPDTLRPWRVLPFQPAGPKGETHGTPGKTNIPVTPDQERLPTTGKPHMRGGTKFSIQTNYSSRRDISSARLLTPNLMKMCRKWNFTVCSLTNNRRPISAFVSPSTQHNAT